MIFETHSHYEDKAFDEDREILMRQLIEAGIERVVDIGSSLDTCKRILNLINEYPFMYGAIGIHPSDTGNLTEADIDYLKIESANEKIVAIGEIGLDYYWDEPERSIQKKWFERQLQLAREVSLPVVIHSRDAAKDTLDIMKAEKAGDIGGVIHCFSYGTEMAREYLDMGFYIGVGGVVSFKNGKKLKEVVEYTPIERIVTETDCPYLAPTPHRGERNSSLYIPLIIEEIAAIKNMDVQEVYRITCKNGYDLYRMKQD